MKNHPPITPADLLLSDASTKEMLRAIESTATLGDLGPHALWAYLHAKQNERIIELLESIEVDTTRIALVREAQS